MPFREIQLSTPGRKLSTIMAHLSSAASADVAAGLDAFVRRDGNALYLHGEGGETHSRRAAGEWLRGRMRSEIFLCTQICHDDWDEARQQAIVRFTAQTVEEDIGTDLRLLGTDYLDLVVADDHTAMSAESFLNGIVAEIRRGRLKAFAVRNWTPPRIQFAHEYLSRHSGSGVAALFTTELALLRTTQPLWDEYVPFDAALERVVRDLHLPVFAHASDINLAHWLFNQPSGETQPALRWTARWSHPANSSIVACVRTIAAAQEVAPCEVNLAWLFNRSYPVIAVVDLPSLNDTPFVPDFERASHLRLSERDSKALEMARLSF